MMSLQIGSLDMKEPRFDHFPTTEQPKKPVKPLHSPLDSLPTIKPPKKQDTPTEENQISGKPESMISGIHENQNSGIHEIMKTRKPESMNSRRPIQKFSTQLATESILAIKRLALDEGKKDYEILQEAVDKFIKKKTA